MINLRAVAISFSLVLSGCANLANNTGSSERGIDGVTCVGSVATSVEGLSEAGNSSLLAKAQMQTGKGGVCSAKVFSATAPVVLYRVFDASRPYTKFGGLVVLEASGQFETRVQSSERNLPGVEQPGPSGVLRGQARDSNRPGNNAERRMRRWVHIFQDR